MRKKWIEARNALSLEEVRDKSSRIAGRLMAYDSYQRAGTVFFYCSKDREVQTRDLIEKALQDGKKVVLPLCLEGSDLQARYIRNLFRDCTEGAWGLMEPALDRTREARIEDVDLLIVPGIAFDLKGQRMGWGKGYFDRFLKRLRPGQLKIGLAFEAQVAPILETEPHDQKVDVLITENRIIKCKED